MFNILKDFFAVVHLARTVNYDKLRTDPAYREEILKRLGAETPATAVSNDNRQSDLSKAA